MIQTRATQTNGWFLRGKNNENNINFSFSDSLNSAPNFHPGYFFPTLLVGRLIVVVISELYPIERGMVDPLQRFNAIRTNC